MRELHGQIDITVYEIRRDADNVSGQLNFREAVQELIPEDAQLHLGKTISEAAVNAETE